MLAETDLPTYKRLGNEGKTGISGLGELVKKMFLELDILHIIYLCAGLIIGRASLSNELLPFGLSFLGLAIYQKIYKKEKWSRIVLFILSVYIGYYTILGWSWLLGKYLLSSLLFSLSAVYLLGNQPKVSKVKFAALNGGVLLGLEIINLFLSSNTLYNNLTYLLGAILVGILTLILIKGLSPLFWNESKQNLKEINILALLITFSTIIIGLPNISIGVINLSRTFSNLVILMIALSGGSSVATIVGVVIGVFYSISNLYIIELTGLYALTGLISGNFKKEGKAGVVTGFILTVLLYTIFLIDINSINSIIAESLLAGGILFLIPKRFICLLEDWIPGVANYNDMSYEQEVKQKVMGRINEISDVFKELSNNFEKINASNSSQDNNLEELLSIITNQICVKCEYYNICWEQDFFKTYQRAIEVLSIAEKQGRILPERVNKVMQQDCKSPIKFSETVNRFLERYETNNFWQQKLTDSKEVIGNQLLGVSQLLEEMAVSLEVDTKFDNNLEEVIQSQLESRGIFIKKVAIDGTKDDMQISLNKSACSGEQECIKQVIPVLNQALDQSLKIGWSRCGGSLGEESCSLEIVPDNSYWVETGVAQVSPNHKEVSGDDYKVVDIDNKEIVSIISDGMGSGKRAALESQTTVKLLEKLISVGFDKKLAIKIVNSTLLLRSTEEVFATVDINAIDCYTGQAEFIKVGSVPTFIKRNDRRVDIIKNSSLPIGIIDNIDIDLIQSLQLTPGDMIVMVTDGVLDSHGDGIKQEEWMMRLLRNNLINDPQSLAEYILQQAVEAKPKISDDMTVLVTKLNGYQNK
ncbi:stage II sporulation protein E [Selenihalanaerobacter shriftii]|uniref:Stage II sporulation protein E n=1 Tax=Selenihalanaerobacter shriftii TaxID=142842 RepID=A0A1T4R5N8_9FIRM|nr:stage II sporulation protein E [Selenihalanaerobacter shriftii]SKA10981.1 stage II sporulation protein E [Selenihalanaerobacter shriftii]